MWKRGVLASALVASMACATLAGGKDDRQARRLAAEQVERQLLEDRLRGQAFQDLQQRYRDQDRRAAGAPPPRLEIPIMRPGCASPSGSRLSTGC